MKFNLAKYSFDSKEQAEEKIEALYNVDADGNKTPRLKFEKPIILGDILLKNEVKDELGEVLEEAIYSGRWHVDMCWYGLDDHPRGWKSYYEEVDGNGRAKMAGIEYNDYKFKE